MKWKPPHPLEAWIAARKSGPRSIHAFSKRAEIPFRSLYRHVQGVSDNPSMSVMVAIAEATKNAVTVTAQVQWLKKRRKVSDGA